MNNMDELTFQDSSIYSYHTERNLNCGMKYEFYDTKIGENVKVEHISKVGNKDFKIINISK